MKKLISIMLVLTMLASVVPFSVMAMEDKNEEDQVEESIAYSSDEIFNDGVLYYSICDDGESVAVSGRYDSGVKDIIIPDTVENGGKTYKVTSIKSCGDGIASLTIGNNIRSIYRPGLHGLDLSKGIHVHSLDQWANISFSAGRFLEYAPYDQNSISPHDLYLEDELVENIDNVLINGTQMGYGPFAECTSLKSINIPDNITDIEEGTFTGCINLNSVTIPNTVATIGSQSIYYSGGAFEGCTSLQSVDIPDSVTSIGRETFSGCTSLETINLGKGVTYIGSSAFSGSKLTKIDIPDSVTDMALSLSDYGTNRGCFDGCAYLETIHISENNQNFSSDDQGIVYNKDKSVLYCCPIGIKATSINFPEELGEIASGAFENCSNLVSIDIPDNVSKIHGAYVSSGPGFNISRITFGNCTNLKTVKIGNGLSSIEQYLFYKCENLQSVSIGNGVINIEDGAFSGCTSLKSIDIPNSVTSIGNAVFRGCTSLKSVDIPDSVTTSINWETFAGCTSLTSVIIGNSVTSIDNRAFVGCTSLQSIDIPDSVTSIGNNAFSGCESLASVTIGDSVTSIDSSAFSGCTSLTSIDVSANNTMFSSIDGIMFNKAISEITLCPAGRTEVKQLPNSVTSIGRRAFGDCEKINSIILPDSVESIGQYAFYNCWRMKSITIPPSVTSIDSSAFDNCNKQILTIYGYSGSYAEKYAGQNSIKFVDQTYPPVVVGINIVAYPTKMEYCVADKLDLSGMIVVAQYSDGTQKAITDYKTAGFNSTTEGTKEVTVIYENQKTNFDVTVQGIRWQFNDETGNVSGFVDSMSPSTMQNYYAEKGIEVTVTDKSGKTPKHVGTGCKVTYKDSETNEVKEYTAIVTGDVTGDGVINLTDAFGILDHINGVKKLTDEYKKAGLVVSSKTISISDAFAVLDHINGTKKIEPKI